MNSDWLLDSDEINTESESKHTETFRAVGAAVTCKHVILLFTK